MKILYHHRTQSGDAQGIHIYEMVKAFRDLGHSVEIVALVKGESLNGEKAEGSAWGWLTGWAPSWLYELLSLSYNLFGYWNLSRAIRAETPRLIYERYSLNTFCGIWASMRFGIPVVIEVNLPLYYELSRFKKLTFKKLARWSERWICSHATWTVVVSAAMKDYLTREGVPAEKMVVMPNGIDPKLFHPAVSGRTVRERFSLQDNIVIGFVGWFREWHGLELLLEIMREADLARRGVRLLFVGDGPAYEKLYQYAKDHHLLSSVIFAGAVARPDVPTFIAAMDIAVLPKTNEYGCPMKVIEYMAMGKCIVAPDQPVIRELLQNNANGYLFTPGDAEDFKRVLESVIENSAGRKCVGEAAYATSREKKYLWSTNVSQTLKLVCGNKEIGAVTTDQSSPNFGLSQ